MPEYADPVIDWLDAGRGIFSRRYFREVRLWSTGVILDHRSLGARAPNIAMYAAPERIIYQGLVESRTGPFEGLPHRQLACVL